MFQLSLFTFFQSSQSMFAKMLMEEIKENGCGTISLQKKVHNQEQDSFVMQAF